MWFTAAPSDVPPARSDSLLCAFYTGYIIQAWRMALLIPLMEGNAKAGISGMSDCTGFHALIFFTG